MEVIHGMTDEMSDLGDGPIILSEDRADMLRESIQRDLDTIDEILDDYHELESEFKTYQRKAEVRLWTNRIVVFILGILLGLWLF